MDVIGRLSQDSESVGVIYERLQSSRNSDAIYIQ